MNAPHNVKSYTNYFYADTNAQTGDSAAAVASLVVGSDLYLAYIAANTHVLTVLKAVQIPGSYYYMYFQQVYQDPLPGISNTSAGMAYNSSTGDIYMITGTNRNSIINEAYTTHCVASTIDAAHCSAYDANMTTPTQPGLAFYHGTFYMVQKIDGGGTTIDGKFQIPNVPAGKYLVFGVYPGYLSMTELYLSSLLAGAAHDPLSTKTLDGFSIPHVQVLAGRTTFTSVVLERGSVISGVVRYDDGGPAEGFLVQALFSQNGLTSPSGLGAAISDDQGRFTIPGFPRAYTGYASTIPIAGPCPCISATRRSLRSRISFESASRISMLA